MKDLQEVFNTRITEFLGSGEMEKKIDTAISKCFDDCINAAFNWGDLNKVIENVVKEKMCISMDQIEIQSYNAVLEEALRQKMTKFSSEAATQMFSDVISGLFAEAPKELTMQELATEILDKLRKEDEDPSNYGEYFHVTFEEQSWGNSFTLKVAEDDNQYSGTKVHLFFIDDGEHHRLAINHKMDITNPTCLRGLDKYLFGLYAGKTKILDIDCFDPDNVDTRKLDADY